MAAVVTVAFAGLVPLFAASLYPFQVRNAPASLWVIVFLARIFNLIMNVRVNCFGGESICGYGGFIFANHTSYLEALALVSVGPVRFLAAIEVRLRPVSGWMAAQAGTIFVRREDKTSRSQARNAMARALTRSQYPPLVVFPEGRLGQGDRILPFSFGAFEIAVEYQIPYLVCAIHYSQPDVAIWRGPRGELLSSAIWRLAKSRHGVFVDIRPIYVVTPSQNDDPRQLARDARRAIARELGLESDIPN